MFTGIVEEVGFVSNYTRHLLKVSAVVVLKDLQLGESVNVSGVCLTVVEKTVSDFTVDIAEETLKRTNLAVLTKGDKVNLERALTPESRFGGHFVQGHIDNVGKVLSVSGEAVDRIISVEVPLNLSQYLVEKGYISVNGVSLTIIAVTDAEFSFTLVPYSAENTNLGSITVGDHVNLEVDIMAKYIERIIERRETK